MRRDAPRVSLFLSARGALHPKPTPKARRRQSANETRHKHEPLREYEQAQSCRHQPIGEEVYGQPKSLRQHESWLPEEEKEVCDGPRLMHYSAYCVPDMEGKVGLCVMLEGFDTQEAAEWFLQQLMEPFEGWEDSTGELVH